MFGVDATEPPRGEDYDGFVTRWRTIMSEAQGNDLLDRIGRYGVALDEARVSHERALPTATLVSRPVQRASRSRVIVLALVVAVVGAATVAVVKSRSGSNRVARGTSSLSAAPDHRSGIRDARLMKPLVFDGGSLQLDVAQGTPRVDEAHAIALFRAGSPPMTFVERVTVVYVDATLRLPVETAGMVIRPRIAPKFDHRPAWAFLWSMGSHSCPAYGSGARSAPAPEHVELIAADGSGEGVDYQTRGSECPGHITGPNAVVASYYVSLPLTSAPHPTATNALRIGPPPPCGDIGLTLSGHTRSHGNIGVYAFVLMARPPCSRPHQPTATQRPVPIGVPLIHDPTGLSVGRFTSPEHFTYFDGARHTTR